LGLFLALVVGSGVIHLDCSRALQTFQDLHSLVNLTDVAKAGSLRNLSARVVALLHDLNLDFAVVDVLSISSQVDRDNLVLTVILLRHGVHVLRLRVHLHRVVIALVTHVARHGVVVLLALALVHWHRHALAIHEPVAAHLVEVHTLVHHVALVEGHLRLHTGRVTTTAAGRLSTTTTSTHRIEAAGLAELVVTVGIRALRAILATATVLEVGALGSLEVSVGLVHLVTLEVV